MARRSIQTNENFKGLSKGLLSDLGGGICTDSGKFLLVCRIKLSPLFIFWPAFSAKAMSFCFWTNETTGRLRSFEE